MDVYLINYFIENYECFDRFTFDKVSRFLLSLEISCEEAKEAILANCALSALVIQERIYNDYYLKISVMEDMSQDLIELRNEIFNKQYLNLN